MAARPPITATLSPLAKALWFLRPARLSFSQAGPQVSVTGDLLTVRYEAVLDRGWFLWFLRKGRVEVPVLSGLGAGTQVSCRVPGAMARYTALETESVVAAIGETIKRSRGGVAKGQAVTVELKVPCETGTFLEFPEDSDQEVQEAALITRFVVRKKAEFRDIVIHDFVWQRSVSDLLPIASISVVRNHEEMAGLQIDVTYTRGSSRPASAVRLGEDGRLLGAGGDPHPLGPETPEVLIPLSFEKPDDTYRITFTTRR